MKVGRRENIWAQGTWSKKIEILPFKFNTLSVYFCSVQWPPIVNSLEGEALTPPTPKDTAYLPSQGKARARARPGPGQDQG